MARLKIVTDHTGTHLETEAGERIENAEVYNTALPSYPDTLAPLAVVGVMDAEIEIRNGVTLTSTQAQPMTVAMGAPIFVRRQD